MADKFLLRLALGIGLFFVCRMTFAATVPNNDWMNEYDGTSPYTVGLWHFNESQIYTDGDGRTCVDDTITGASRRARLSGSASFAAGGKFGFSAHNVGGTTGSNHIEVVDGANLFPGGSDPSLTVECWVKFNSTSSTQFIIDKQYGYSDTSGGYRLYFDGSKILWRLGSGSATMYISGTPPGGIVSGRWYHIAGTWDAGTDTSRLYIDGAQISSNVFSGKSIVNNSYSTKFAQRCTSTYAALNGSMDEVRISNVAYIYEADVNYPPPSPVGRLYPDSNNFCFTFYSTIGNDSNYTLQHGSTAIGPYYGDQSGPLSTARALGTYYIYKVRPACMVGKSFLDPCFVMPSDSQIINDTAAIVNSVKHIGNIVFWDIEPEELRYWYPNEMHYLDLVSQTIRDNDPCNRPVFMYEPNHRNAYALKQTLVYQDICAKGMYVNTVNSGEFIHNRIWSRWSMEQELEAVSAVKPDAAPWIVLWMAADADPAEVHLIDDWCRHDAYMGLIMGGKGIQIWSGYRNRSGFEDDFDAYLNGYLSVAEDLNGSLNLAPVFLYGTKQTDTTMNITAGPSQLQLDYDGTHYYPPVTYLATVYNSDYYLFMLNSAEEPVTAVFGNLPCGIRKDLFSGETEPTTGGSFSITLPALAVKAFRFAGRGDFNADGWVDFQDLARFTQAWLSDDPNCDIAPPCGDGSVNFQDFIVLALHWRTKVFSFADKGDFNADGRIDFQDLERFTQAWLANSPNYDIAPFCGDGKVNFQDFSVLAANWQ